jgi:hypothetical protein
MTRVRVYWHGLIGCSRMTEVLLGGGAGWLWFGLCYGPGWQVKSWQGLPVGSVTIAAACFGQTFMYAHAHGDVVNDGDRWEHQDMDGHVGERETERGDTSQ